MASPGRSLPSHFSRLAIVSSRSPSPDQLPQSNINVSSSRHRNSAECDETVSRCKNRALTVNTTLEETFSTNPQPEGEDQDSEGVTASPLHPPTPMQDVSRQSPTGFSPNDTDFSVKLRSIPVDFHYSMDRFLACETHSPRVEAEALQILDGKAQTIESDLRAVRRHMNEMEEDEALCLIGSIHAQ
jgi:hypothetical protein